MSSTFVTELKWGEDLGRPELRAHRDFLDGALPRLQSYSEIIGILGAGSLCSASMDEFSDIDLVIVVEPEAFDGVMARRLEIAEGLGPLLSGFTGEHVGEPRLLICLYGPPLLHVDLKFVALPDLAKRVEEPLVLWARDGRVGELLGQTRGVYPQPDWQWIEDRFWVWIHYGASKIGRGELLEADAMLGFLNSMVFGPLSLQEAGRRPNGLRHIERDAPERAKQIEALCPKHTVEDCLMSYHVAVMLYESLRTAAQLPPGFVARESATVAAVTYLDEIGKRLGVIEV